MDVRLINIYNELVDVFECQVIDGYQVSWFDCYIA